VSTYTILRIPLPNCNSHFLNREERDKEGIYFYAPLRTCFKIQSHLNYLVLLPGGIPEVAVNSRGFWPCQEPLLPIGVKHAGFPPDQGKEKLGMESFLLPIPTLISPMRGLKGRMMSFLENMVRL